MTYQLILISILIFLGSCNSSSNTHEKYPDLVEISPPKEGVQFSETKLVIRSIEIEKLGEDAVIVIKGDFPNACTKLQKVEENLDGQKLDIQLTGWQNQDEMCAQMITPFTFLFEPDSVKLSEIDVITVNNAQLQLDQK